MRTGFIGNSAGQTQELYALGWGIQHCCGLTFPGCPNVSGCFKYQHFNGNYFDVLFKMFCSILPAVLLRVLGSSSQKKGSLGDVCVSWGFLITDKNCGKPHRWTFSFTTQQDLALLFLRSLLLSEPLFMQFDCYDMYCGWNLKCTELEPTSKWPLIGNSVIFEIPDVKNSPFRIFGLSRGAEHSRVLWNGACCAPRLAVLIRSVERFCSAVSFILLPSNY